MPTWIKSACETFLWLTETSGNATATARLNEVGWVPSSNNYYSGAGPYTTDRALVCQLNNNTIYHSLGANYSELHLNFHFKAYSSASEGIIIQFTDSGTNQVDLRQDGNDLRTTRNATTLATAVGVFTSGSWHFIQIRLVVNDTTGRLIVRINNVEQINFSGDTKNTANAYVNRLNFVHNAIGGSAPQYANFVGYSDSASWPLAEARYLRGAPDAAGNSTQFTPLASTNVSQIDEQQSDSDTTYNSSTTPGNIDLFGTDVALNTGDVPLFILEALWGKKDDAGTRDFRHVLRTNSTNYESSSTSLTNAYLCYTNLRDTNPDTSAAWTPAEINALEIGYKDQA